MTLLIHSRVCLKSIGVLSTPLRSLVSTAINPSKIGTNTLFLFRAALDYLELTRFYLKLITSVLVSQFIEFYFVTTFASRSFVLRYLLCCFQAKKKTCEKEFVFVWKLLVLFSNLCCIFVGCQPVWCAAFLTVC